MRLTKAFIARLSANPHAELDKLSVSDISKIIKKANDAYYNTEAPLISDDIYDIINDILKSRDSDNPVIAEVGADIKHGQKATLPVWMGSMDKIKADPKALESFKNKWTPSNFVVMDKLDGVSALFCTPSLLYTRGNGKEGQDISHLLPLINGIPKNPTPGMWIRGELILSKKSWSKLSVGANARNAVSGIVNAKRPDVNTAKLIDFVPYSVIKPELQYNKQIKLLHELKFNNVHTICIKGNKLTVEDLSKTLEERRTKSPYEVDGLVIAHNEYHPIVSGKNPSSAFAFKHLLTQDSAEVTVENVEWHVSKDGLLKPTVTFAPVKVSGVTIRRATGFNGDFIESNSIGPGARLVIVRSGDVIPHIIKTLKPADKPQMPDIPWSWTDGKKEIRTKNATSAQDMRQLTYFFEKLKVRGFSVKTVEKLYNNGYKTVKAIVEMPSGQIRKELHDAIKSSLNTVTCVQLMQASNAFGQGFGERKLTLVAKAIPRVAQHYIPTPEELTALQGFSQISATKYIDGLKKYNTFCEINGIKCLVQKPPPVAAQQNKQTTSKSWEGQVVVFTGFRNAEWKDIIEANGGTVGATITKATTLVVAKDLDKSSSKLQAAIAKGIKVVQMDKFSPI